uniref:GNAT family N-acetyltransferase n=1 Tax=Agathobacter sp. TaxID=2021311 RepID=UPI0040577098
MQIRKAKIEELDSIMKVYAFARKFMEEHKNPTQWGQNKPSREQIESDILAGKCHLCIKEGQIAAVFYFAKEADVTYAKIYDGNWINDEPYAVVHRIASSGIIKGAGSFCMNWASGQCENLKIDTHKDNYVMQNMLKKCGFVHCGTIYLENGEERLAFHKTCGTSNLTSN